MFGQSDAQRKFKWEWIVICSLLLAVILMLTGHQAHLFGALPYLLLLACPLMHLFMHKNHNHHHDGGRHDEENKSAR